ncbi:carbohydrate esterase family 5 protein [Cadophora sp. DSE1049]|nr:carbohydrate esterase family 5 protein [Cadophora sp. DSE1049]
MKSASASPFLLVALLAATRCLAAPAEATAAVAAAAAAARCNDVQVFLARGHGETAPGRLTAIVNKICAGEKKCGYQSINYDANSSDTICDDQAAGIEMAKQDLANYGRACLRAKLVLAVPDGLGGALISDIIAGGDQGVSLIGPFCVQPNTTALDPSTFPGNRVAAVVTFGELHHTASQSYNVGNGSWADGTYPRNAAQKKSLNLWSDRFHDFCNVDDPACARGSITSVHYDYFVGDFWPIASGNFVRGKVGYKC